MELVKLKEQINQTIELFDSEMVQQLGQNLFIYFLLNRVEVTDDEVIISVKQRGEVKKINYNKGQFFAKMIEMARNGFDLLAGDFTLTPFWDATFKQYSPSVVISYKKHLQILKEKGYTVNVYYLRKGDTFVEIKPYFHKFDIKPKAYLTKKIENGKAINDVLFYGVEIVKNSTGQPVCSYVESTENIKARANFNNDIFPNSPNAQDTMYVKFVLNRAYEFLMNYGENSLPDIDKLENYASLAPVDADEVKQIENPEPQTFKKLKKLDKNSKLWETAIKRLAEKTATIEQITANFEVDENDLLELRNAATKNLQDPEQNNGGLSNEI